MKALFENLRSTKLWKYGVGILLAVGLVNGGIYLLGEFTRLPPSEEVKQALMKTINAKSYRYSSEAKRTIDKEESIISQVSGEKTLSAIHIKGNLPIIKAEIEAYRFEDKMYRRDSLTKDWVVIPVTSYAVTEQLIAEINPLSVFDFSEDIDVTYTGTQKVQRRTCRVYEIMKRGENKYLQLYWTDYTFKLWIDKREGVIKKAEVNAEHRDNSRYLLNMTVMLWDFNEPIVIERPSMSG